MDETVCDIHVNICSLRVFLVLKILCAYIPGYAYLHNIFSSQETLTIKIRAFLSFRYVEQNVSSYLNHSGFPFGQNMAIC